MRWSRVRFTVRWLMIVVAGTCLLLGVVAALIPREPEFSQGPMGRGSPERAARWKARLDLVDSPEAARARFPEVGTKRFGDGTWLVVVAEDSHGDAGGGTVVVKDSSSRLVRAFFGHVCGAGYL